MLETAAAVGASLVAVAFAMATYERWLDRRRRHELAWSIALVMFAVAAAALAAGASAGWGGTAFKLFYLFGAILNVPFLALGTIYLHAGPSRGDRVAAVVAIAGAFAAGVLVATPFTAPLPREELARGSEVFGPLPRILAAVASAGGALTIFVGALWSAARVRTRQVVVANLLIALGTAVLSASGLLNSVLGEMTAFALTLAAGVSVLFAGFLVATARRPGGDEAASLRAPEAIRRRT